MPEKISKALQNEATSVLEDAHTTYDETIKLVELIECLPRRIEAAARNSCDTADSVYEMIRDKRSYVATRILELEKLPSIDVPFGVDRLLEVAERCQGLSDIAWDRLKELAIALKEK